MKSISTPVSLPLYEIPLSSPASIQVSSSRSVSADLLKAISIIAVVLIHCSALLSPERFVLAFLLPTYRFCVPVFIFLWAHFAEKSIRKNGHELRYLTGRIYKLIIPFIVWSTVYYFITADGHAGSSLGLLSKYYSGYGWSGQYYFIILFQLLALFIIIRRLSQPFANFPLLTVIGSLLFYFTLAYSPLFTIGLVNKISGRFFIYWLPYVLLGVIYRKDFLKLTSPFAMLCAFLSPILIAVELNFFQPYSEAYFIPSVFTSSMLLCITFLNISFNQLLSQPIVAKALALISRNTLGIFCLNPLIILVLSRFHVRFDTFSFPGESLLILAVCSAFIICACLGLVFTLRRLRLGALVTS